MFLYVMSSSIDSVMLGPWIKCEMSLYRHDIIYCSGDGFMFHVCVFIWVAEWQLMCIVELISTGDGPNNWNARECRNKAVCVGCTERAVVVSFIIILFVLCNASVSALQTVFSKSLYAILILQLPWLSFFRAFSLVVRQMPEQNSQRRGTARNVPN